MRNPAAARAAAGFTLIELIVAMVIMALLAAVAAPRFFQPGDFEAPAFANELAAAARYAQKLAVNTGCPVRLELPDASHYRLRQPATAPAAACDTSFTRDVLHPATGEAFAATTPNGVSIGGSVPLQLEFAATGVPHVAGLPLSADLQIPVGPRRVVVLARSGYVDVE